MIDFQFARDLELGGNEILCSWEMFDWRFVNGEKVKWVSWAFELWMGRCWCFVVRFKGLIRSWKLVEIGFGSAFVSLKKEKFHYELWKLWKLQQLKACCSMHFKAIRFSFSLVQKTVDESFESSLDFEQNIWASWDCQIWSFAMTFWCFL
jgi:hypothetical protein